MQLTNRPRRLTRPWANSATGLYTRTVPDAAPGGTTGAASYEKGFPPETFQPVGSGGIPPNGADMNGGLFDVTGNARWTAAGGTAVYDATFAAAIGGYPKLAVLASTTPGTLYQSTVDNNTTDPDSGGSSGWVVIAQSRIVKDGQVRASLSAPNQYSVTFTTPFPTACTSVVLSGFNGSASALRDNWPQLVASSTTGFTYVIQTTNTASDTTLDGIDWLASGR